MHRSDNNPGLPAPASGKPDADTQNVSDGGMRSLDVLRSALAAIQERVRDLEDNVRQLQSQNTNRS